MESIPKVAVKHPDDEELKTSNSTSYTSSPSHEFSFTLTMQPNTPLTASPCAVDLSPADDIFFYGHLLPLHLFPNLPISPRISTNSLDSLALPGTDFSQSFPPRTDTAEHIRHRKNKSFIFFKKWKKGAEIGKAEETEQKRKQRKFRFEMSSVLKRYARLVRPSLMFGERRRDKISNQFKSHAISYSGNLSFRASQEAVGGSARSEYKYNSAPASIRTSPVNSGILLNTAKSVSVHSPMMADSTMEELQSAIQAAIAHCKNSISTDENCKL